MLIRMDHLEMMRIVTGVQVNVINHLRAHQQFAIWLNYQCFKTLQILCFKELKFFFLAALELQQHCSIAYCRSGAAERSALV